MALRLTDNRKVYKSVYQVKPGAPHIVAVPDLTFLVLHGQARRCFNASRKACAQQLHLGHYRDTYQTAHEIESHIAEQGYLVRGEWREIYLNPPNWNPVEKWQTIVRAPIE